MSNNNLTLVLLQSSRVGGGNFIIAFSRLFSLAGLGTAVLACLETLRDTAESQIAKTITLWFSKGKA